MFSSVKLNKIFYRREQNKFDIDEYSMFYVIE